MSHRFHGWLVRWWAGSLAGGLASLLAAGLVAALAGAPLCAAEPLPPGPIGPVGPVGPPPPPVPQPPPPPLPPPAPVKPAATVPEGYTLEGAPVLVQGRVRFVALKDNSNELIVDLEGHQTAMQFDAQAALAKPLVLPKGMEEIQFRHGRTADGKPIVLATRAATATQPGAIDLIGDDPDEAGLTLQEGGYFGADGKLLFYRAITADGKELAVIRGVRHELDAALLAQLRAAHEPPVGLPNAQRTDYAYVVAGEKSGGMVFTASHTGAVWPRVAALGWSPDGTRFLYLGQNAKQETEQVCCGLKTVAPPNGHRLSAAHCGFGPDGQLVLVWETPPDKDGAQNYLLQWGKAQFSMHGSLGLLVLASAGDRIAWQDRLAAGSKAAPTGGSRFVVGGEAGPVYGEIRSGCFSADGAQFACRVAAALPAQGEQIAREGKLSAVVQQVAWLAFSPDGKRLAAVVQMASGWYLVDDDRKTGPYTQIDTPQFDRASGRLMALAHKAGGVFVLNGAEELGPFDAVSGLAFGAGGEPFFAGRRGPVAAVYLGTRAVTTTDGTVDGAHGVVRVERKKGFTLVLSDGSLSDWEQLDPPVFSADGRTPVLFGRQEARAVVQIGATQHAVNLTQVDAVQFAPDGKGVWVMGRGGVPGPGGATGRDIFVLMFPATPWVPGAAAGAVAVPTAPAAGR